MDRTKISSLADAVRAAVNGVAAGCTSTDEAVQMVIEYVGLNYCSDELTRELIQDAKPGADSIDLTAITGSQTLPVKLLDVLQARCGIDIQVQDGRLTGVTYTPPAPVRW